jgi:MoxR-like ATPase
MFYTMIFVSEDVKVGDVLRTQKGSLTSSDAYTVRNGKGDSVGQIDNMFLMNGTEKYGDNEEKEVVVVEVGKMSIGDRNDVPCAKLAPSKEVAFEEKEIEIYGTVTKYRKRMEVLKSLNDGISVRLILRDNIAFTMDNQAIGETDLKVSGEIQAIAKAKKGTNILAYIPEVRAVEDEKKKELINEIKENLSKKNIDVDAILDYLKENKTPERISLKLLNFISNYADSPVSKPKNTYKGSEILNKTLIYLLMGKNLMLEGERGVGKNVLAETLSWVFQRPLFEFPMNSQHDNTSVLGSKSIEVNENGQMITNFVPETIIKAAEVGGFLVYDEMNTGLAHVWTLLHSLHDHRRRITVPGYGMVEAHPAFRGIGTQNRGYVGTFDNNEASYDRFVPIIIRSNSPEEIRKIIQDKVPDVSDLDLTLVISFYSRLKKSIEAEELEESSMTIRGLIDACEASVNGIDIYSALLDCVANRAQDNDTRKQIESIIGKS